MLFGFYVPPRLWDDEIVKLASQNAKSCDLTPKLESLANRVEPLVQHTPLATFLTTSCVDGRGPSLIPTVCNKDFAESAQDYMSRTNVSVKVLGFV